MRRTQPDGRCAGTSSTNGRDPTNERRRRMTLPHALLFATSLCVSAIWKQLQLPLIANLDPNAPRPSLTASSSHLGFTSLTTTSTAPTDAANMAAARSKSHAATNIRAPPTSSCCSRTQGRGSTWRRPVIAGCRRGALINDSRLSLLPRVLRPASIRAKCEAQLPLSFCRTRRARVTG